MFENIKCIVCDTVSVNITEYLSHIRIHRRDKQFACPFTECEKKFGSFQSFRKHIRFRHVEQNLQSSARSYRCSLAECDFEEQNFERIMRHATAHISSGQPVYCPLRCPTKKPFATSNSFRIHKMYAHRRGLKKPELLSVPEPFPDISVPQPDEEMVTEVCGYVHEEDGEEEQEQNPLATIEKHLGTLFLTLLAKHHVTNCAIQEIVEALTEVTRLQEKYFATRCEVTMQQLGIPDFTKTRIIGELCDGVLLSKVFSINGIFRSVYTRKKYYRENFSYVPPVQVSLQKDGEHNDCFYYYVPILDTLRELLNDKYVYNAVFRNKVTDPDVLNDFTDGLKFRNSSFFSNKTINIFIYQDAAEVVPNQLGNAVGRHKLLLVYMVLGNLPPHLRCLTENVHLVLVCKNKDFAYFGTDVIFRRLIEDVKLLEEEGIVVHGGGRPETIHGSVFATMNDNLGAHQLAGLCENFSKNSYFCRTCYTTLDSFRNDPFDVVKSRTPELNTIDLQTLECNSELISYRGVKVSCVFNELTHFKMFDLGAVPCVAHDLFEGWVNYDLYLIFKKLVANGTISLRYLEGRINSLFKQLKISTKITLSFSRKSCNIKAKACDVWHLVQILPFIFTEKSEIDYDQPAIVMLLLIKKITDIITSPVLSTEHVKILASDLREYIELRKSHFNTPLRPKHHFTLHYPRYILWMGPIINYCTLFCERKHCFFKRCLRTTLNFKNVVKFCSEQHQYTQGLLNTQNKRFKNDFLLEKYVESFSDLPSTVQGSLRAAKLDDRQNIYAEKGIFLGYTYTAGDFVFLRHDEYGDSFIVVKIVLLVYNQHLKSVTVFGNEAIVRNILERGVLEISQPEPENFVCLDIHKLIDRAPLASFEESGKTYLFIKHTIPIVPTRN